MRNLKLILSIYNHKRGNLLARGIAYSMLLATIPFLLMAIYGASLLFRDTAALQGALNLWLHNLVPEATADMVIVRVSDLFMSSSWKRIGILGLIMLFFTPQILFASMESALSVVMMPRKRTNFIVRQILYFLMQIFVVSLFFLFSIFSLWVNTTLSFTSVPPIVFILSSKIISLFIVWFSLIAIYSMVSGYKLHKKTLISVSFVIAFIWLIFNFIGSIIVTTSGRSEVIYGLLAGFVVLMFWAYIFSALLLLGGIVIAGRSEI